MRLEQTVVRIPPEARPNDRKSFLTQQPSDHGNVHRVEVDLSITQALLVSTPVLPKMANDLRGESMRGLEISTRRRVFHRTVGQTDAAHLGE